MFFAVKIAKQKSNYVALGWSRFFSIISLSFYCDSNFPTLVLKLTTDQSRLNTFRSTLLTGHGNPLLFSIILRVQGRLFHSLYTIVPLALRPGETNIKSLDIRVTYCSITVTLWESMYVGTHEDQWWRRKYPCAPDGGTMKDDCWSAVTW